MAPPSLIRSQSGFTLIELLVVVVIVGITTAIALPSFTNQLRVNRVASEVNELLASISVTRSEALKRGVPVQMCGTNDQVSCGNSWVGGWIVWSDLNFNGDYDAGEEIRVHQLNPADVSLGGSVDALSFDRRGFRVGADDVAFTLRPNVCAEGLFNQRTLSVTPGGRVVKSQPEECP